MPENIAVIIPCFNEAAAIGRVIEDFRTSLPGARIWVFDNNSTDGTADVARAAGAVVRHEPFQGKGNVVRRMFADVDADIYVMVDGDDTYDAASAPKLVARLVDQQLDMVTGARIFPGSYRRGHVFGNRVLTGLVATLFRREIGDMLSGYRVLSRRFVKSFPLMATGFDIEPELTIHALELRMKTAEVETPYRDRGEGSVSKLRTFGDGFKILRVITHLLKEERPVEFFGTIFVVLALLSIAEIVPVVLEFMRTGQVPRIPTAVLATGTMLLAFLSLACGLILDTVTLGRRELKRLHYLAQPVPGADRP
ncbi:MAG: glycosyltransferase family 2 protein [Geminicoccaceae bacterium]